MMLRHIDEPDAADAVEQALMDAYRERTCLTADVGGTASTTEFADHVADRVTALVSST
jgi:isocitrate dehydrogenase (NAD+)